MLRRLITGLLKRCRRRVYLGFSRYDERGYEQIGELRVIFDYILRGLAANPLAAAGQEELDAGETAAPDGTPEEPAGSEGSFA
jgi:hypothetical protein